MDEADDYFNRKEYNKGSIMATVTPTIDPLTGIVSLDMRVSPQLGKALYDDIVASVKKQQLFIITTLPSVLIVTQKQFASLENYSENMYHTTDRMMDTGMNVMEIQIDREVDVVKEIDEVIELSEAELKQRQEFSKPPTHEEVQDNPNKE